MERIQPTLFKLQPQRGTERGELLEYFTEVVNCERDGKKYKKLTVKYMGMKLMHLSKDDLYYMRSVMQDMERRGGKAAKWFWWSTKPQEPQV